MIDILKFGFVKVGEFEEGMPQSMLNGFWHKIIDGSHFVELVVLANIFTISYNRIDGEGDTHKMKIG